jgi:hypothetical protein
MPRWSASRHLAIAPGEIVMKRFVTILLVVLSGLSTALSAEASPIGGCAVFPADNVWNHRVDSWAVHAQSANYVAAMGTTGALHIDVLSSDPSSGLPYVVVPSTQPLVNINFVAFPAEADPGPYPIPPNAPIEGGPSSTGDRHVLVVQQGTCKLFELFNAFPQPDGSWKADVGDVFNLGSDALRTAGNTSTNASGLPELPGLLRYDEVASGVIDHALFLLGPSAISNIQPNTYVWPARHFLTGTGTPPVVPLGIRFRLKSSFDISAFPADVRVILAALKTYGAFFADVGTAWYLEAVPDARWNDADLNQLHSVPASAFEAVDSAPWQAAPDSGAVVGAAAVPAIPSGGVVMLAAALLLTGVSALRMRPA